jgi:RNA:NAD 2'-phosphotransferase (TPT1/KptA family)
MADTEWSGKADNSLLLAATASQYDEAILRIGLEPSSQERVDVVVGIANAEIASIAGIEENDAVELTFAQRAS